MKFKTLLLERCALRKVYVTDGQNMRDQIKVRCVHSIHSWKSQRMLATYMRRMRINNLEIRITGSSCHPQLVFNNLLGQNLVWRGGVF